MQIVFNYDGSIKFKKLDGAIQQGNNGVNFLDVAVDGRSVEDYQMKVVFELPDEYTKTQLSSVANVDIVVDGNTYHGHRVALTSAETLYNGILKASVKLINPNNVILYSYQINLIVNPTASDPDESTITTAQYDALLGTLTQYQVKFAENNVRYYDNLTDAQNDLGNLANNQFVFVRTQSEDDDYYTIYQKFGGALVNHGKVATRDWVNHQSSVLTKQYVDEQDEIIKKIAMGMSRLDVLSYQEQEPDESHFAEGSAYEYYDFNDNRIETYQDFLTYIDGLTFGNPDFNTDSELSSYGKYYLIKTKDKSVYANALKVVKPNIDYRNGDSILTIEGLGSSGVTLPDRWYANPNIFVNYDISGYVALSNINQAINGIKTFLKPVVLNHELRFEGVNADFNDLAKEKIRLALDLGMTYGENSGGDPTIRLEWANNTLYTELALDKNYFEIANYHLKVKYIDDLITIHRYFHHN